MGSTSGWQTKAKAMIGMVYAVWGNMGTESGQPPHSHWAPAPTPACQNLYVECEVAWGTEVCSASLSVQLRLLGDLHETDVACDVGKVGRQWAGHLELFVDDLVGG